MPFLVVPSTGTVVQLTQAQADSILQQGKAETAIPTRATTESKSKQATKPKAASASAAKASKSTKAAATKRTAKANAPAKPAVKAAEPDLAKAGADKSTATVRDVREAAKRAIMRHGRPMPRRELFKNLTTGRNALNIAGKDPVENMATMLYKDRDKSFQNLKGQGFWLKDQPLPAGASQTPTAN